MAAAGGGAPEAAATAKQHEQQARDDVSSSPSPDAALRGRKIPAAAALKAGAGKSSSLLRLNQDAGMWGDHHAGGEHDASDSELSDSEHFLAKGAFLLTPSHELSIEKASSICEKMNFKGLFSLTKTATGILFKFSEPEDYQAVFKKGFHKVTGARFYKKVPIPCRPQKTFSVFVLEVPEDIPEEDVRHSLYKFNSVVEVTRLPRDSSPEKIGPGGASSSGAGGAGGAGPSASSSVAPAPAGDKPVGVGTPVATGGGPPPLVRVTLASLDESNVLLQNGLDFYGATFFPTEAAASSTVSRPAGRRSIAGNRTFDVVTTSGQRVRDHLPVFDAAGFSKIPPPTSKTIKPRGTN
ncbi:hypothetical protein R5R35_003836 [Gryllus longicercus]|uniref:Uncharacterized protein n=1 Tax=Gryllus longicercus TaxID=2509291 RepID=A0AAN9VVE0_9ORTH